MIYVVQVFDSSIITVYESEHEDLREKYNDFIQREAEKLGVKIFGYWNQIGSYNCHNMTRNKYNMMLKKWNKFIKTWSFEYFINHFELAEEIYFKQVLQK